jgi:hypothetical protein
MFDPATLNYIETKQFNAMGDVQKQVKQWYVLFCDIKDFVQNL